MNELISVGNFKTQMTSLEIAELTGKEHNHIMRDIRTLLEQLDIEGQSNFGQSSYINSQNKEQPMYALNHKGILCLASGYDANLRMKIIDRWEELEMKDKSKVPTSFREALLLAAEQQAVIEKQQEKIEVMQPKEDFYDAVVDSKDAIDMGQVAKVLNMGIGRNTLFQILRDKKVLMPNNNPYQQFLDNGYFRCVESRYMKPNGDTCINIKTVVFQKGLEYIRKIVNSHLNNK